MPGPTNEHFWTKYIKSSDNVFGEVINAEDIPALLAEQERRTEKRVWGEAIQFLWDCEGKRITMIHTIDMLKKKLASLTDKE